MMRCWCLMFSRRIADGVALVGREDFARRLIRVGSGTVSCGFDDGELAVLSNDCSCSRGGFVVARERTGDTCRLCLRALRYFGVSGARDRSFSSCSDCVVCRESAVMGENIRPLAMVLFERTPRRPNLFWRRRAISEKFVRGAFGTCSSRTFPSECKW